MAERVLLVGMMGSGKTTIGERLAARLGYVHVDSDEQVEATTGRTVREIWESDGEAAFRAEESRALKQAVADGDHGDHGDDGDRGRVVAVAGGAVGDHANRVLIKGAGTVVWLRARVESLADRVTDGDHRPLLGDDPEGTLRRLDEERRALYEEVASIVVDVDDLTPDEVVERIIDQLGGIDDIEGERP